jgi:hypothetical protein
MRFAPGSLVICGPCWHKAPEAMRSRHRACLLLADKYHARCDIEKGRVFDLRAERIWQAVRDLLNGDEDEVMPTGLPPLMAEQLRSMGLA